ncbi:nucleotidyltransferase family protein [Virgibacillus sp. M23]|uniref:nucleotidyltransferase family protein n=1 Tax=Virgibacillus sp. M23 TaxID=3079030 RepID=UPI002A908CCE|nr:nucleotidyltransferase family protein [Virgibacillus sp. M23]MDY7044819.1 nucleotidyltransferase family protein [Virgibacillus sp. M23]
MFWIGGIFLLKNKEDVRKLIQADDEMMEILQAANTLNLPDWWICAGFIRAKIWDTLHGFTKRTTIPDVDVIYFDIETIDEQEEKILEAKLKNKMPNVPWSVKNEARMHIVNNIPPYTSSVDAISKFPETATALGVKLDKEGKVIVTAPCCIADVINLQLKPTPYFTETREREAIYEERIRKKKWKSTWNKLNIYHT